MAKKKKENKKIISSIPVDLEKNFLEDAIIYGTYVAKERALPDVRDGLKPVARRIIYTMLKSGNNSDKPFKKSALLVGKVMGEYHPHGDISIYETMLKMSHYWNYWFTLVNVKGNKGTLSGDKYAAQRYTETKLTENSEKLFELLNQNSVDFVDNYDGTKLEPTVLPTILPLLLINGTFGISVGFISSIPQHNPIQAIEAYLLFCKKKTVQLNELLKVLEGPDFTTGGEVYDFSKTIDFYESGEATLFVRGKTRIENNKVIIYEIPTTLAGGIKDYSNDLQDKIADGTLTLASNVEDYTNAKGVLIEVTAKDGVNPKDLEKELYDKTKLQSTRPIRFNVIENGIPTITNLMDYFESIHNFGVDTIQRYYSAEKIKIEKKIETLSGLISILENDLIDPIIDLIRSSSSKKDLKEALMFGNLGSITLKFKKHEKLIKKLSFTESQTDFILETKLSKLSRLSHLELIKEKKALDKELNQLDKIIEQPNKEIIKILNSWLKNLKSNDYFNRKTLVTDSEKITFTPVVIKRKSSIVINQFGYLRSLKPEVAEPLTDNIKIENVDSDLKIGWFSSDGNFNSILVDSIGTHNLRDKGVSLSAILKLESGVYPIKNEYSSIIMNEEKENKIIFVSELGKVKKTKKSEFYLSRKKVQGTKLGKNDSLIYSAILPSNFSHLILITQKGEIKKIPINLIPEQGRVASGVLSGILQEGDKLAQVIPVRKSDTFTISGKEIKASEIKEDKLSTRFKKII